MTGQLVVVLLKPDHRQRKARAEPWFSCDPLQHTLPGSPILQVCCWPLIQIVLQNTVLEGFFGKTVGAAAVLLALAAGASVLFTNNTVGSKPRFYCAASWERCYLEVISAPSFVVLSETPSFPAGEVAWSASNQQ